MTLILEVWGKEVVEVPVLDDNEARKIAGTWASILKHLGVMEYLIYERIQSKIPKYGLE